MSQPEETSIESPSELPLKHHLLPPLVSFIPSLLLSYLFIPPLILLTYERSIVILVLLGRMLVIWTVASLPYWITLIVFRIQKKTLLPKWRWMIWGISLCACVGILIALR